LKYALLILRADKRGVGGIVALLALLHARNAKPGTWRAPVLIVGVVGPTGTAIFLASTLNGVPLRSHPVRQA